MPPSDSEAQPSSPSSGPSLEGASNFDVTLLEMLAADSESHRAFALQKLDQLGLFRNDIAEITQSRWSEHGDQLMTLVSERLTDPSPVIRHSCARLLTQCSRLPEAMLASVLGFLEGALTEAEPDQALIQGVVISLGHWLGHDPQHNSSFKATLVKALPPLIEAHAGVHQAELMRLLQACGDSESTLAVARSLQNSASLECQRLAAAALVQAELPKEELLQLCAAWLTRADSFLRQCALEGLTSLGAGALPALTALVEARNDDNPYLRSQVRALLESFGDESKAAIAKIQLRSEEPEDRQRAVGRLLGLGVQALPTLLESFRSGVNEAERQAAHEGLRLMGAEALPLLIELFFKDPAFQTEQPRQGQLLRLLLEPSYEQFPEESRRQLFEAFHGAKADQQEALQALFEHWGLEARAELLEQLKAANTNHGNTVLLTVVRGFGLSSLVPLFEVYCQSPEQRELLEPSLASYAQDEGSQAELVSTLQAALGDADAELKQRLLKLAADCELTSPELMEQVLEGLQAGGGVQEQCQSYLKAQLQAQPTVALPRLVRALQTQPEIREPLTELILAQGESAYEALIDGLQSHHDNDHGDALEAIREVLGRVSPGIFPSFVEALGRDDLAHKMVMLDLMVQHPEASIPQLIPILRHEDTQRQHFATQGLSRIGAPALPAIFESVKDQGDYNNPTFQQILFENRKDAIPHLEAMLSADHEAELSFAISALVSFNKVSAEVFTRFVELLGSAHAKVRKDVTEILSGYELGPQIMEGLLALIQVGDAGEKARASERLLSAGPEGTQALFRVLEHLDDETRAEVTQSFQGAPERIGELVAIYQSPITDRSKEIIVDILLDQGDEASEALIGLFRVKDKNMDNYFVSQLKARRERISLKVLIGALKNKNPRIRFAAITGLENIGGDADPALAELTEMLEATHDDLFRAKLQKAIESIQMPPELPGGLLESGY